MSSGFRLMVAGHTVRSAETPAELDAFFRLKVETFMPAAPPDAAMRWRAHTERSPDYIAGQIRCIFDGTRLVGGYILTERTLRIGSRTVPTGCFGSLVTHPGWRGRGIARALMHDAAARATERRLGLVLLDGIAGFYHRFGYTDVLDLTRHTVSRAHVLALSPSSYLVRPATGADAPALLELYQRHYSGFTGSFVRDAAWQHHDLATRLPDNPPLIALDAHGRARGYLILPWYAPRTHAVEVAADDWPATLGLLQQHARLTEEATELDWPLPPDSPAFYALADHLYVTSRSHHHPDEGWMACPAHLPTLFDCIKSLLETRLRRAQTPASALRLRVGTEGPAFGIGPGCDAPETPTIMLSSAALAQLLFGFRPAHWIAGQPCVEVDPALVPALDAIFPIGHVWVPGSDAF